MVHVGRCVQVQSDAGQRPVLLGPRLSSSDCLSGLILLESVRLHAVYGADNAHWPHLVTHAKRRLDPALGRRAGCTARCYRNSTETPLRCTRPAASRHPGASCCCGGAFCSATSLVRMAVNLCHAWANRCPLDVSVPPPTHLTEPCLLCSGCEIVKRA